MTDPNNPNQPRHLLTKLWQRLSPLLTKLIFILVPYLFFPNDIDITIHNITFIMPT